MLAAPSCRLVSGPARPDERGERVRARSTVDVDILEATNNGTDLSTLE